MRTSYAGLFVLAALAAVPLRASAQDLGYGAHAMPTSQLRLTPRWDTFVYSGSHTEGGGGTSTTSTTTAWANVFSVQADFRDFVINLAIPLGWGRTQFSTTLPIVGTTTTTDDQAELGNIELEGYANLDLGSPEHRLLIGGGLALPTATDQYNPMSAGFRGAAVRGVSWITSFRNAAAWADQSFTIWPTASYRFATDWVLVRASGSIPLFFPTHGDYGGATLYRGNVEMMLSLDVSGAIRINRLFDAGLSFLGWALPSGAGARGNPDLGQTALTAFIQTDDELDFPVGGGFEMIFDLDNGWGPTGEDRKYWGAHLYVYGRFDLGDSVGGSHETTPAADPAAAPADSSTTPSWE